MLPCQVTLKENSKYNLTLIFHIMKILMMHERGIFLDLFLWRPLPKKTGNMMWNLLSPLNWFHNSTSNYKSTMQKEGERQGVEVWAFYLAGTQGCFIPISQLLPWTADSMWRSGPERKITISISMHCHIMPYFNCSLYNSMKSGPEAVPSLFFDVFVFHSMSAKHSAKGLTVLLKP